MKNSSKKKGWLIGLIVALGLCLAVAAAMIWYTSQNGLQLQLVGDATITQEYQSPFADPGASACFDGFFMKEASVAVQTTGEVNTEKLGTYRLTYTADYVMDLYLFTIPCQATVTRDVQVVDTQAPQIQLLTDPDYYTLPGGTYEEEGFTAADNHDGDLTAAVVRTQTQDQVTYTVTDSSGNTAQVVRTIEYTDPIAPELTLLGAPHIMLQVGTAYTEAGATATDNCDGDLSQQVTISGQVDTNSEGIYTLNYSVKDNFGNETTAQRTIFVSKMPVVPGVPHTQYEDPLPSNGKVIYLTFDDGPSEHTPKLLDILDKYQVKATFFVVNAGNTPVLKRMAEAGHVVAIHSATHDYATIYSSKEAYWNDLKYVQQRITEATGIKPMRVRFPGGSSNNVSAQYTPGIMTELARELLNNGYRYYDWHISSQDAAGAKTRDEVYYYSVSGIAERSGDTILLQHDTTAFSVEAAEMIIQWGIANGYRFEVLTMNGPYAHHRISN